MAKQTLSRPQASASRESGAQWEKSAELFLCEQGLKLLQRNFSSRLGEIDLIMEDETTIVFVEVKYRKNSQHGSGADAVTFQKQRKISQTAAWYLARHPHRAEQFCRFDVISIETRHDDQSVNWIKGAFYSTIG
jgi:putative endonuclease